MKPSWWLKGIVGRQGRREAEAHVILLGPNAEQSWDGRMNCSQSMASNFTIMLHSWGFFVLYVASHVKSNGLVQTLCRDTGKNPNHGLNQNSFFILLCHYLLVFCLMKYNCRWAILVSGILHGVVQKQHSRMLVWGRDGQTVQDIFFLPETKNRMAPCPCPYARVIFSWSSWLHAYLKELSPFTLKLFEESLHGFEIHINSCCPHFVDIKLPRLNCLNVLVVFSVLVPTCNCRLRQGQGRLSHLSGCIPLWSSSLMQSGLAS